MFWTFGKQNHAPPFKTPQMGAVGDSLKWLKIESMSFLYVESVKDWLEPYENCI